MVINRLETNKIIIVIFYQIDFVISIGWNIFAIPYTKEYKFMS